MDVQRVSCWTLAEALGHSGPHRLQHFLSRAVWHHDAARDRLACWAVAELADDQAVLVVDETGDEKSSTDAVGASRQYSGALGGIGLCQVAVHLTYAAQSGHALIDRALYLARDWAGDDERRELAHVPGELCFATRPQLAAMLLERARDLGLPARWVAADEVYGGRDLRMRIRELGYDYTMAVPSGHYVTTRAGRFTAAALTARLPRRAWQRLKTGQGGKGDRHYDWAMIEVVPDDTPPDHAAGHAFLLVRRHRYTRELSFCRCHSAAAVALGDLVAVVCRRWSAAGPAGRRSPAVPGTSRTAAPPAPPPRGPPAPQMPGAAGRDPAGSRTAAWSTAAACPPAAWPAARGASARRSACAHTPRPPRGSAAAAGRAGLSSSAGPRTPPGSHGRPARRSAAPDGRSCGPAGPARPPRRRPARPAPRDPAAGPAPACPSGRR